MSYINDRLCEERSVATVGLFISIISEMTGNVIACNAGHTSPIVIDDNGPHFMCEPNDKRLGRNQGETFELSKCYLANNDMVLLYSQGIVNVRNSNDELFGMERLLITAITAQVYVLMNLSSAFSMTSSSIRASVHSVRTSP